MSISPPAGRSWFCQTRDEAAAIVRNTGTGVAVALDDQTAIVRALRDVITGKLREATVPDGLDAYRYPAPAMAMLDVVQEAITVQRSG